MFICVLLYRWPLRDQNDELIHVTAPPFEFAPMSTQVDPIQTANKAIPGSYGT